MKQFGLICLTAVGVQCGMFATVSAQEPTRLTCAKAYSLVLGVCIHEKTGDIVLPLLADAGGMTLYVFDKDVESKSACDGACVTDWTPYGAPGNAVKIGNYSVIVRGDGSKQWAIGGRPLYTSKKDRVPGDVTDSALSNGSWHVANP